MIAASAAKLVTYFAGKGTPLAELNATRPPDKGRVDAWLEECSDAAEAAGIVDKLDRNNVGRWIDKESTTALSGTRAGKAAAVADALVKKGIALA